MFARMEGEVGEVVAKYQWSHCRGVVVVEEEGMHLLTLMVVVVVEEVEEDRLLVQEEVVEEEGHLPPQVAVEEGTCHLMENLAVEGQVGVDMWVKSLRAEQGGQCPWLKGGVVVVVVEVKAHLGSNY